MRLSEGLRDRAGLARREQSKLAPRKIRPIESGRGRALCPASVNFQLLRRFGRLAEAIGRLCGINL